MSCSGHQSARLQGPQNLRRHDGIRVGMLCHVGLPHAATSGIQPPDGNQQTELCGRQLQWREGRPELEQPQRRNPLEQRALGIGRRLAPRGQERGIGLTRQVASLRKREVESPRVSMTRLRYAPERMSQTSLVRTNNTFT